MEKKWLIGIGILLLGTLAWATTTFNDDVTIFTTSNHALRIIDNGGVIGFNFDNVSIPTLWVKHIKAEEYYGQTTTTVASLGYSCTDSCNKLDVVTNYSCTNAWYADGVNTTCSDVGRLKNCVCKN